MKNLEAYNGNCFDFHTRVVESKKDAELVTRLKMLNQTITQLFDDYQVRFNSNNLENLASHGFDGQNKADLLNLYNIQLKALRELKNKLTTGSSNRIFNTCQYCTINEVFSLDHILPKEEYSEFVVHPKNLFPSCTQCNTYKSTNWIEDGSRLFLNLYLDQLPEEQYLYVDLNEDEGIIQAEFYLENNAGIDEDLFELIENHYERLHLLSRFATNSYSRIAPLEAQINTRAAITTYNDIQEEVLRTNEHLKKIFGYNHWGLILENELVNQRFYEF